MCHFWFNTFFIQNYTLTLRKPEIDKANKDKKHKIYKEDFFIEVLFANPTGGSAENLLVKAPSSPSSSSGDDSLPRKSTLDKFKESNKDEPATPSSSGDVESDGVEDEDLSDDEDEGNEWAEDNKEK